MALIGILANGIHIGAINTSHQATLTHNFGPSSIFANSTLFKVDDHDDGGCTTFVDQVVDDDGTHSGPFFGRFASNCTSVTYRLKVTDCTAGAMCVTEFFS